MSWKGLCHGPSISLDQKARFVTEPFPIPPSIRQTDRAQADLRRGVPVVLTGSDGQSALVLSTEQLDDAALDWLRQAGEPELVLTERRASILHITGDRDAIGIRARADKSALDLLRLADPVYDLSHPMKGPFDWLKDAGIGYEKRVAAVDLCKLAKLLPSVVALPLPDDMDTAGFTRIFAADIAAYKQQGLNRMTRIAEARLPTDFAETGRMIAFRPEDGGMEHIALIIGEPDPDRPVLARLHSSCLTGDFFGSLRCDCGPQLRGAVKAIFDDGGGVLLYMAQEGRGIGLINKLRAYNLQDQNFDTIEANERLGYDADERLFAPAAEMLRQLGFGQIRLMTNNPDKVGRLTDEGIDVVERVSHAFPANPHNAEYLDTKARRAGHYL